MTPEKVIAVVRRVAFRLGESHESKRLLDLVIQMEREGVRED